MDATQIILIVFIVVLLIAYPIMMYSRNKKENQRMQEQTNSLKRGDKVLTTSGVYGTVVDLHLEEDKKIVTIETGTEKKKGYISVDAYAIYTIFRDEEVKDVSDENKEPETANTSEKSESKELVTESIEEKTLEAPETEENTEKKSTKKRKKD